MSMVTTLVSLSQFFRTLAVRMRNKAVRAIEDRIDVIQDRQVKLEERRSALMVDCHYQATTRRSRLSRLGEKLNSLASRKSLRLRQAKRMLASKSRSAPSR